MLWAAADCYSHYLQVKLREIHFGFSLFFFFLQRSERQLLWWWDTKTALAANVHEWEEHWGWVCECVTNECGCVSCIKPRIMPWRGSGMICQISWIWCVFYCLLNRRQTKSLDNDLFALVKVLMNSLYSSPFCCLSVRVTHKEGCTLLYFPCHLDMLTFD